MYTVQIICDLVSTVCKIVLVDTGYELLYIVIVTIWMLLNRSLAVLSLPKGTNHEAVAVAGEFSVPQPEEHLEFESLIVVTFLSYWV